MCYLTDKLKKDIETKDLPYFLPEELIFLFLLALANKKKTKTCFSFILDDACLK